MAKQLFKVGYTTTPEAGNYAGKAIEVTAVEKKSNGANLYTATVDGAAVETLTSVTSDVLKRAIGMEVESYATTGAKVVADEPAKDFEVFAGLVAAVADDVLKAFDLDVNGRYKSTAARNFMRRVGRDGVDVGSFINSAAVEVRAAVYRALGMEFAVDDGGWVVADDAPLWTSFVKNQDNNRAAAAAAEKRAEKRAEAAAKKDAKDTAAAAVDAFGVEFLKLMQTDPAAAAEILKKRAEAAAAAAAAV